MQTLVEMSKNKQNEGQYHLSLLLTFLSKAQVGRDSGNDLGRLIACIVTSKTD